MKLAKELTTTNSLVNDSESEDQAVLLTHNRGYWNASVSWSVVVANNFLVCQLGSAAFSQGVIIFFGDRKTLSF